MSRFIINSIPFETRIHPDAKHILARDQARAKKFLAGILPHGPAAFLAMNSKRNSIPSGTPTHDTIDVTESGVAYSVPVGVGQPPTTFYLLLDTSLDQITLGGNLVAKEQIIGVTSSARGFSGVDGILGIGPVNLSSSGEAVSPVTKNLFDSGLIPAISIGMSYMPDGNNVANGQITLGATDTVKYYSAYHPVLKRPDIYDRFIGSVNYVPITTIEPSDKYWGIDADLTYSKDMPLLRLSAGIFDIGTTFLLLASDAYKVYRRATRAEEDR
ncbi:hypothetical protein C0993_009427 [Termitomyces sp. T159_Od127]|nr:hypothetical protein C0993_009427 [Termitomyces sp. T159_Od127]